MCQGFVSVIPSTAYREPHVVVYCDSGVEIYDAEDGKWLQTVPIRKVGVPKQLVISASLIT